MAEKLHILADKNIPYVASALHRLGRISLFETGELRPDMLHETDTLVVRSETRVDARLLEGSPVRFVGTATIGTDHIDLDYLRKKGIAFASAPGCNANSVSEYVTAALLHLSHTLDFHLKGASLGVVGVGNVGSKVVKKAEAMGVKVLQNDPPLARKTGGTQFLPLDDLMGVDILTLHVPLTESGDDATYHLFDDERISKMKRGSILINTSRGAVAETGAIKRLLANGHLSAAVLDVWEGEPAVDVELLDQVKIGTPHIAGYSLDGKVNAVSTIQKALCEHFGVQTSWSPDGELPPAEIDRIVVRHDEPKGTDLARCVVSQCYDIMKDDKRMRAMLALPKEQRAAYFRQLRIRYPVRREFSNTTVVLPNDDDFPSGMFRSLGFEIEVHHKRQLTSQKV